ncbi:MAG: mechanosensitive ion channel family protein, partial [Bacteroidota bacterium]
FKFKKRRLFFKPFKVGDFIQAQGELGSVHEIQIFNTYLRTADNKTVILPNGPLANGNIVNFTNADNRRVDFTFGIAYGDNYDKAKELLNKFISEDERILTDPAPFIGLGALADSSVNITVRAWTAVENYWPVFFELNERVYKEFGKEGLNIPFPQMDVHVKQQ